MSDDQVREGTDAPEDAIEVEPERIHGCVVTDSRGQQVLHVPRERYLEVCKALKADGFVMCIDVTAVDYLATSRRELPEEVVGERFEVIVQLLSHAERRRIRLRVQVPGDDPTIPTLFDLWPGSESLEREVYDMFGITFTDHPDMTRILMPDDWEGHPLRKDYSIGRVPVQFKYTAARYDTTAGQLDEPAGQGSAASPGVNRA